MLMKLTPWRGKTLTKYIKALIDLYGFNLSIISWWQKPVLFFISNYQNDYNKWSETVILITLNTYVSRKLFFTYFNWIYVFFSQLKASCNVYADVTSAQYVQGTESWSVVSLEKMQPNKGGPRYFGIRDFDISRTRKQVKPENNEGILIFILIYAKIGSFSIPGLQIPQERNPAKNKGNL